MPQKKTNRKKQSFAKRVTKVIQNQSERKRISKTWSGSGIQDPGRTPIEASLPFDIVAGTGSSNRIGHQIRATGLYGELYFTAADTTNVVRLVVYKARKRGDTLSTDALSVYGTIDPDKYFVYTDKLITLSQSGSSYVSKKTIKLALRGLKIRYDTTTGFPLDNDITIYVVSDSLAITDPTLHGHVILWYQDL